MPRVGPRAFLLLAQASLVLVVLNIVSGAAVRLTDSGLGCPDWPTCSARSVTPPLSFHPVVEFSNRMVVVALSVVVAVTLIASWLRRPRRRDLAWPSAALVGGVVAEAVLGGVVVYSKLNPYAVMTHFMVGIALLTVALVLALRSGRAPAPSRFLVPSTERRLAWLFSALVVLAIAAGTATTGSGPHAGGPNAVRLPVPLDDMARTHSAVAIAAGALLLLVLALLRRARAPEVVERRGELMLVALMAQGALGYTQFFLHLPALLVGFHVFGATVVWSATVWFVDGLRAHGAESETVAAAHAGDAPAAAPAMAAGVGR
jgi:cytochrome c oxidase assembly protein subunit 15